MDTDGCNITYRHVRAFFRASISDWRRWRRALGVRRVDAMIAMPKASLRGDDIAPERPRIRASTCQSPIR